LVHGLVIEDDPDQARAIARLLGARGIRSREALTSHQALAMLLPAPDLIVIDVHLGDELAFSVLEATMSISPVPLKVAISGLATPDEAFRLASFGVRSFLQKPFSAKQLNDAIDQALLAPPDPTALLPDVVGHRSVREVQGDVRTVMVRQALALTGGSRSGAARLLRVSRQAVQQMIQHRPDENPGEH
jgi:CheY-like chemotaxis protein